MRANCLVILVFVVFMLVLASVVCEGEGSRSILDPKDTPTPQTLWRFPVTPTALPSLPPKLAFVVR